MTYANRPLRQSDSAACQEPLTAEDVDNAMAGSGVWSMAGSCYSRERIAQKLNELLAGRLAQAQKGTAQQAMSTMSTLADQRSRDSAIQRILRTVAEAGIHTAEYEAIKKILCEGADGRYAAMPAIADYDFSAT